MSIESQWKVIERIREEGLKTVRHELGKEFLKLQEMYSRKSNHPTSGDKGVFESECHKRGFVPNTVRNWIHDYKASQDETKKTTAEIARDNRAQKKRPD